MTKRWQEIEEITRQVNKRLGVIGLIKPLFIEKIRRDAITLRHLFECECNGAIREKAPFESHDEYDKNRSEYQIPWIEKRQAIVLKRLDKRLKEARIPYYIQSDPRGASLYLCTTSRENYSTEGVAIY